MRVLHITTLDIGGAGICCLRIHQALLEEGIESKVITWHNTKHIPEEYSYGYLKYQLWRFFAKLFMYLGFNITQRGKITELSEESNSFYSLPVSPIDLSCCKWIEWADVIHLHWVNNYLDYPTFFHIIKKPIVWTLHDENLFYGIAHLNKDVLNDHPLEKKYKIIKKQAVQSAVSLSLVFLSKMMYDKYGDEKIISGRKKYIIPNFVDTQVFKILDKIVMRQKYKIDINKKVFVFISFNISDPNKGLDVLSKTLYDLNPTMEILAIGENPNNKYWENVRCVGLINNQSELCELISCANYMAMPSNQEAFSLSPIEAMSCGIPVVAFPVSGTDELINEKNGVVCDDFSEEALRKGIETLMRNHYDSYEIRQDMINRFSPHIIAQKYINLYNSLIAIDKTY